jgi:hypothetical protein
MGPFASGPFWADYWPTGESLEPPPVMQFSQVVKNPHYAQNPSMSEMVTTIIVELSEDSA